MFHCTFLVFFLSSAFEEITLVAAQELTNILKQGYLEKKRKDHSFFSSEWQKRWCVISNNIFYYFGNEKDKQQKGAFYLNNCTIHRKDSKKCHGFEVITSRKRAYQFTAANQKEASDWVDQLTFLLKDMKSTCIPYEEEDDGDNNNTESSAEAQEENINEDGDSDTYDDIDTPSHASSQALPKMGNTEEKVEDDHDDSIYEMMPEDDFTRQPSGDAGDNEIGISSGTPTFDYVNCYQGLWDCTGEGQDELSFHQGEIIYILSKEYNVYGWWVGERNGVVGIVPKDYLTAAYEI
ncbi:src kinase-associated phosphoprotein 1 [Protopterus annectens]|uniref:src kinase-associated phosphoprotein 1 n=1 Tax=Protopterus annectens TaxID=7888 RepID=UPI001CFA1DD3|nr:src kinase-associated phosphoprotein 1 [Protopterus annectens]